MTANNYSNDINHGRTMIMFVYQGSYNFLFSILIHSYTLNFSVNVWTNNGRMHKPQGNYLTLTGGAVIIV